MSVIIKPNQKLLHWPHTQNSSLGLLLLLLLLLCP